MRFLYPLILAVLAAPVSASADSPHAGAIVTDLLVVRPVGIVAASVTTATFFAIVVPAWVVGVDDRELAHYLVKQPWGYVRQRELGDF